MTRAHAIACIVRHAALGLAWAVCALAPALAQTSPAHGPLPAVAGQGADADRELADYLALLRQIAPASETGARTYVAVLRLRCGQAIDVAALRRAMAQDGGEPALMELIRASATQDRMARHQAVAQIQCPREAQR